MGRETEQIEKPPLFTNEEKNDPEFQNYLKFNWLIDWIKLNAGKFKYRITFQQYKDINSRYLIVDHERNTRDRSFILKILNKMNKEENLTKLRRSAYDTFIEFAEKERNNRV